MATLMVYSQFDYRNAAFGGFDGFDDQRQVTTASGGARLTMQDDFQSLFFTGRNLDFQPNQGGLLGILNGLTVKLDGTSFFSLTGLNHDLNVSYFDDGYALDGRTLEGLTAELANWLNGDDSLTGSAASDRLAGFSGNDTLNGAGGNDVLEGWSGNDSLLGGAGHDALVGGRGKDVLTGGVGNDRFDFNALNELGTSSATQDVITDFTRGQDKIDLAGIDANARLSGDQAFTFVNAFTANASTFQVRYSGGVVYLNTDADTSAEYQIQLTGSVPTSLTASDFML